MAIILIPFKLIVFILSTFSYGICAMLAKFFIRDLHERRRFYTRNITRHTRFVLKMFGGKLDVINPPPLDRRFLFVGNHLGFLDILLLSSFRPCLFITSVEMRDTPFLGQLCEMGGCLYVERRSRAQIENEITEIREALKNNHDVVLYPEGTSTNGEKLLPFKKSLMTSAAGTGVPILPMVLNYTHVNDEPMSHKWRDHICWYGDISFVASFFRILSLRSFKARIEFLDEVHVLSEEHRRQVASRVQAAIEEKFIPILAPDSVVRSEPTS